MAGALLTNQQGTREPFQLRWTDSTVTWSGTKVLTLTASQFGAVIWTNTAWLYSFPDASSMIATVILAGTEFLTPGPVSFGRP